MRGYGVQCIELGIEGQMWVRRRLQLTLSEGTMKICWELAHRGWEVQQPPTPSCRGAAGVDRMFGVLKTGALQHFPHAMPPPPPPRPTQLPPLR